MANRHKAFKKGGKVAVSYGNADVISEAKKRASGGEVGKVLGRKAGGRLDKTCRKLGGKVSYGNADVISEARSTGSSKANMSSAGGGSATSSPFSSAKKG